MKARVVEVILTYSTEGDGKEESPFRIVNELWTKSGQLICSFDQYKDFTFVEKKAFEALTESEWEGYK